MRQILFSAHPPKTEFYCLTEPAPGNLGWAGGRGGAEVPKHLQRCHCFLDLETGWKDCLAHSSGYCWLARKEREKKNTSDQHLAAGRPFSSGNTGIQPFRGSQAGFLINSTRTRQPHKHESEKESRRGSRHKPENKATRLTFLIFS